MTTQTALHRPLPTTPSSVGTPPKSARWLGALLIAEALLAFAPLAILAPTIGWPASLDAPAAEQMANLVREPQAVTLGYTVYLLYSILVAPVMVLLAHRIFGSLAHPAAATVAAFAALSALSRSIGILRWLTVMPMLAAMHQGADPATRAATEQLFLALTTYGGGIGEVLGVSLFMAVAVATLSIAGARLGGMPRGLAASGVVVAILLAGLALPSLGVPLEVPVAVAVTLLSLWMLALGVWCLRR
jgi:hypothetical protein